MEQTQTVGISSNLEVPSISTSNLDMKPIESDANKIVESFSDDSKIGRSGRNRIQIDIAESGGSDAGYKPNNLAIIKFYSLNTSKEWVLKQTIEVESHALMNAQPMIEDFNNDKLKDVTFISNTAARGANEVRTLLIYDKIKDVLILIKNSEDYPNLAYNNILNCIDAWLFHGATTTVFLKLEDNLLREFASVETGAERVVTLTDINGKTQIIRREKMAEDDIYTRYRSFNPPKP